MVSSVPHSLLRLVETGLWPTQGRRNRILDVDGMPGANRIEALAGSMWQGAPRRGILELYPHPFRCIADRCAEGEAAWWDGAWMPEEPFDRKHAVVIGDLGFGSEAPIVLDATPPTTPRVLVFRYDGNESAWVELTADFDTFVEMIGIARAV